MCELACTVLLFSFSFFAVCCGIGVLKMVTVDEP
jgi:hypothetical protein